MLAPSLLLMLLAAQAPGEVAPLVVTAQPKAPPPTDATVVIGADEDRVGGHKVGIWPDAALRARVRGQVVLTCKVNVHGLAETCRVAYEQPLGHGFGAAALSLRPTLTLTPKAGPDGPIPSEMNVAIEFKPPNTSSNLADILNSAGSVATDPTGRPQEQNRDVNIGGLQIRGNPVKTRRITMLNGPAWSHAPGFEALDAAYPAQGGGAPGYAVAHCRVQPTGVLSHCKAAIEEPAGRGFGQAAVALTPQFRVAPEAMASAPRGAPVEVDVPVRFAPPGSRPDRTVRAPVWLATFDPEAAARVFPAEAAAKGVQAGAAVLRCNVREAGALDGCEVMMARPDLLGFDEAALALARSMRMNLWSADARPVQGGDVLVSIEIDRRSPN
ncbi:hypothetical protein [Phenylobacterium sp.]|jgi:outer membrane biosynthesis protein TonB|uniref:hypothetical protein n=1 Tax=Phenylobacterium sp. TaxID=1871053 RepID=UPI002F951A49